MLGIWGTRGTVCFQMVCLRGFILHSCTGCIFGFFCQLSLIIHHASPIAHNSSTIAHQLSPITQQSLTNWVMPSSSNKLLSELKTQMRLSPIKDGSPDDDKLFCNKFPMCSLHSVLYLLFNLKAPERPRSTTI